MSAPAPVAVPELADMPSLDTAPICEKGLLTPGLGECDAPARWRMTLVHVEVRATCEPFAVLACDRHRDEIEEHTRDFVDTLHATSVCGCCSKRIQFRGDLIRSVVAL